MEAEIFIFYFIWLLRHETRKQYLFNIYLILSSLLTKRKTIQNWNFAHILPCHGPYLKTGFFCFFEKVSMTAAILEELPCHVNSPLIFSIALSGFFSFWQYWHEKTEKGLLTKFSPNVLFIFLENASYYVLTWPHSDENRCTNLLFDTNLARASPLSPQWPPCYYIRGLFI